jgi:hypothetical protein
MSDSCPGRKFSSIRFLGNHPKGVTASARLIVERMYYSARTGKSNAQGRANYGSVGSVCA